MISQRNKIGYCHPCRTLHASEPTIRKALAIGADDAIRVNAESSDAWFVAAQIAEVIKKEQFDIIMCGIESSDYNGSTVGGMISEFLGIPSVSAVSGIKFEDGKPVLTREIDGGKEVVTVPAPFVAIVQKGIAKEPRIAAMRGIMMARSKPVKLVEPVCIDTSDTRSYYLKNRLHVQHANSLMLKIRHSLLTF